MSMILLLSCTSESSESSESTATTDCKIDPNDDTEQIAEILERGCLLVGINGSRIGFGESEVTASGETKYTGFDVEFGRALGAAIFGADYGPDKVSFVPVSTANRFSRLQGIAPETKSYDILIRTTTWNFNRDAVRNFTFSPVTYYDGTGIMVNTEISDYHKTIADFKDLRGSTICVEGATTNWNALNNIQDENPHNLLVFPEKVRMVSVFALGRCDAWSGDQTALYSFKLELEDAFTTLFKSKNIEKEDDSLFVLDEVISKEPLAAVTRDDSQDARLSRLASLVIYGMISAESLDLSKESFDESGDFGKPITQITKQTKEDPENYTALSQLHLLGISGFENSDWSTENIGAASGPAFMQDVITQVGNYGEAFSSTVSESLGLSRGLNELRTPNATTGILYSPPALDISAFSDCKSEPVPNRESADTDDQLSTAQVVKNRGFLRVGISCERDLYDTKFASAIAIAVLGSECVEESAGCIKTYRLSVDDGIEALKDHRVDVLAATVPVDLGRMGDPEIEYSYPSLFKWENDAIQPYAPVTRSSAEDSEWADLVRWVVIGMIEAAEQGITSENIGKYVTDDGLLTNEADSNQKQLLGPIVDGDSTVALPIPVNNNRFMQDVIQKVGNRAELYKEFFIDPVVAHSDADQILNRLWDDDSDPQGLFYAPPFTP